MERFLDNNAIDTLGLWMVCLGACTVQNRQLPLIHRIYETDRGSNYNHNARGQDNEPRCAATETFL